MRSRTALLCLCLLGCPATASAGAGGASSEPPPTITSVKCRTKCAGGAARAGSQVLLKGKDLAGVTALTFSVDAAAVPKSVSAKRVVAVVPAGTISGPVTATDGMGRASAPSPVLQVLEAATPERTSGPIATALKGRKAFVDGTRRPTLSYRLQTSKPAAVTVNVINVGTKAIVDTIEQGTVEPGEDQAVAWAGKAQGRYAFVVSAVGTDGAKATTAQAAEPPDTFVLLGHQFPIRGKHSYGEGAGRFGAGRSGHSHQGQDVFAKCGTPLVAARGGTVKINKFQGNAGNYLVIDNAGEGTDTMYAHLRDVALPPKGARVHTGDPIGFVGDTGDAQGCHLHFEEWGAPGWYTGGSPFDPFADLKAWDALS